MGFDTLSMIASMFVCSFSLIGNVNAPALDNAENDGVIECEHPINLYKDGECIYAYEDLFHSRAVVYSSTEPNPDIPSNLLCHSASVQLTAYPILLRKNFRYKAHLCVHILATDIAKAQFILLQFRTRTSRNNHTSPTRQLHVQHTVIAASVGNSSYITIGCYWDYSLIATFERTVELTVRTKDMFGRYYFRVPDWERLNGPEELDSCMFEPFVYVEEGCGIRDTIVVTQSNCTRDTIVEVHQIVEASGQAVGDKILIRGSGRATFPVSQDSPLMYYRAWVKDVVVADEEAPSYTVLIAVVMVFAAAVGALFTYLTIRLTSENNLIFLARKPRVKFIYDRSKAFDMYRRQTEIFIMFMVNHCNVAVTGDFVDDEMTPLSEDNTDIEIIVPFPGSSMLPDQRVRTARLVILLPFWSTSDPDESFQKTDKFRLMDEFFPFVRRLQKRRRLFEKCFRSPVSIPEMTNELNRLNMTNDGFLFCLNELNRPMLGHDYLFTAPVERYPDFDDMEL